MPPFEWKAPYRIRPPKQTIKTSEILSNEKNRADMAQAEQHIDMVCCVGICDVYALDDVWCVCDESAFAEADNQDIGDSLHGPGRAAH